MEDFDLKEFAKMFDAALASDNPAVKKALRNFMMVSALVDAHEDSPDRIMGPLETLVKKVSDLERMVYELQNTRVVKDNYYKDYYNNPTWISTGTPYITSTTSTSGTTWMGKSLGYVDGTAQEISELLKDLKFNENKSD